jgi:hypothetical protein
MGKYARVTVIRVTVIPHRNSSERTVTVIPEEKREEARFC